MDADAKFVNVFIGWPGCSHDARCFSNSPIYESLENGTDPHHVMVILGDSAYPLRPYLLTPYKGPPEDPRKPGTTQA